LRQIFRRGVHGTHAALLQEIGAILGVCNPICAHFIGDGLANPLNWINSILPT
jgi:hypothetical protein